MKTVNQIWKKDGYTLRLAESKDAEAYYQQNYSPLDPEVARLTGCKASFTHDEVVNFFLHCIEDEDRYDFLIIAPDGRIIGESVINEIDWRAKRANFRICLFHLGERDQGIGFWAVKATQNFAFETLHLHRLELNVFSFNPRAMRVYQKAGFKCEGILRDAIWDGEQYADDILMAILEDEWRERKEKDSSD